MEGPSLLSDNVLIQALVPQLAPTAFASLCIASKTFYTKTKALGQNLYWITRKRLYSALVAFFNPVAATILITAFDCREAYITGGFLLAVINGDPIDTKCDVDIAVHGNHHINSSVLLRSFPSRLVNALCVR
jgi:hypothetical protein